MCLPVLAAVESIPGPDDPPLHAFLRFFDDPSLESYERHLGGLKSPAYESLGKTLRYRVSYLLAKLEHTKDLAKQIRESVSQK